MIDTGDSLVWRRVLPFWMRNGVEVRLNPGDRERLAEVAGDRDSLQERAWRAEIAVLTADGIGTNEIMRRTGKSAA
ncbi:MAG: hypothetical protein HC871_09570 [Rhizobiales bacterium]|nr:hypothetical protein [Hyphomicrobiales bacterium]